MIIAILWGLLAVYLAVAALFAAVNMRYVEGGWWRTLVAALCWPALLVVLWQTWRRGD